MRLIPGSELLLIFCAILQYRYNIFIIRKVEKFKEDVIRMETEKSWQEKEARRRRLSEKIGAALMAGSMIWTPGGPLSWAFVLGGGIAISQQQTAYAQQGPTKVTADTCFLSSKNPYFHHEDSLK